MIPLRWTWVIVLAALAGCTASPGTGRAPAPPVVPPVVLPAQAGPATPEAALVAAEAARIVANARTVVYSHTTKVDEAAGLYELDCSGLVRYILHRSVPAQMAAIAGEASTTPRAVEFYEVFKARLKASSPRSGWTAVPRLLDARPGDLIAWRLLTALPGDTGHIVIVASTPVAESDGSVRVVVIDSTTTPHDADTRPAGVTGVGCGTMWFRVDATGAPVAYRRNSRLPFQELPTAIGRLTALPPA